MPKGGLGRGGFSPFEIARAYRDEHPGKFDQLDDAELVAAIRDVDPDTYGLIDPLLEGAELSLPIGPPPTPAGPRKPPAPPNPHSSSIVGMGLRTVPAVLGAVGGSFVEPGFGTYAGGALGAGLGETGAQWYEKTFGEREHYSPGTIALETGLGALNPAVKGATVPARIAGQAAYGAMLGGVGGTGRTLIEEGRLPSAEEALTNVLVGGAFGGATHGAVEGLGAVGRRLGQRASMGELTGALPTELGPPPAMADQLPLAYAAAAQYQAEEASLAEGLHRVFGANASKGRRGDYHQALEAKSYLEELADLNQSPVPVPPYQPGLTESPYAPPPGPPQLLLPETAGPSGLVPDRFTAYPPEGSLDWGTAIQQLLNSPEPVPPEVVGELQQAIVQAAAQHGVAPEALLTSLIGDVPLHGPGPDLELTGAREARILGAGDATGATLPPDPTFEQALRSSLDQPPGPPRLVPRETPQFPTDRPYTEGPNAGPKRVGELHQQPRPLRRRVKTDDGYRFEQVDADLPAEDPGTYPPDVRRELARMAWELEEFPFEPRRWEWAPADMTAEGASDFTAAGGQAKIHPAVAGAPVYHDILQAAGGARAHATRAEVIRDLRAALHEGRGSHLSDAAAQIARERLADEAVGGRKFTRSSSPGAGDDLIGWVDEVTGDRALPHQDLDAAGQMAREADDGEILAAVRAWAEGEVPPDVEPFVEAARAEARRRGLEIPEETDTPTPVAKPGPAAAEEAELPPPPPRRESERERKAREAYEARAARGEGDEPPPPPLTPEQIAANEAYRAEVEREWRAAGSPERRLADQGPPGGVERRGVSESMLEDMTRKFGGRAGLEEGALPVPREPFELSAPPASPYVAGAAHEPRVVRGSEPPEGPPPPMQRGQAEDVALPGLEGVREEARPMPEVAEAPFSLVEPPPAKPRTPTIPDRGKRSAIRQLLEDEHGVLVFDTPYNDRQGLKAWLKRQEKDHGGEAWFARVEQAIEDGDWDKAWQTAAGASVRSYTKALAAATPAEEARLIAAVRGTPLQEDINTQLVANVRRRAGVGEAPRVKDFPPSRRVTQAGAARGKATLGPAGILSPGPRQRPLSTAAPELRAATLDKSVVRLIMEDLESPEGLATIPGNQDTYLRLFRQVGEQVYKGQNLKLLREAGVDISPEELAQHWNATISDAGRTLQMLSQFAQAHQEVLTEAAEAMSMGGALRGVIKGAPPVYHGRGRGASSPAGQRATQEVVDQIADRTTRYHAAALANDLQKRRPVGPLQALHDASYSWMLSKWNTAVRNYMTFVGRYGVESLDHALTIPIARLSGDEPTAQLSAALLRERGVGTGKPGSLVTPKRAWSDDLQGIYDFTADNLSRMKPADVRRSVRLLLDAPNQAMEYLGAVGGEDLSQAFTDTPVLRHLTNPAVQRVLTMFNRAQEFSARATVFDATTRALLRAKGLNPIEVLQQPTAAIIQAVGGQTAFDDLLFTATSQALEATFAGRTSKDSIPGALIRFVNQAWPLKLGMPFPRFNFSSAPRWIYDHSPAALLDWVRFPLDRAGITAPKGSAAGGRLYRGVRAQEIQRTDLPALAARIGEAERAQGTALQELLGTQREYQVRQRQVARLEKRAQAPLPGAADPLTEARGMLDQLARRRDRLKATIHEQRTVVNDLKAEQKTLLARVADATGINAPNFAQSLARMTTGTVGMLGAAWVIRSQEGAQGTKWYEYRVDRGEGQDPVVLDFRPFAPFAQYLFVADVLNDFYHQTNWAGAHKQLGEEGSSEASPLAWSRAIWNNYEGKYTEEELGAQFAQAFLSISRAAGTTLTLADLMTQNGWPSLEDAARATVGTIGQFFSRFTVPFQNVEAIPGYTSAFPGEAVVRTPPKATIDDWERPLAGPLANVPGVKQLIPERVSQTTGEVVQTEYPFLRGGLGIGTSPRDFVMEEARRIGVPGSSIFIRETGDVGLDRAVAESYSQILKTELPGILQDPQYTQLGTPARQRDFLQRYVFPVLKRAALAEARSTVGDARYEAGTVKGEAARRQLRQARLLDQLEAETPSVDDVGDLDAPPGPPAAAVPPPPPPPGLP